MSRPSNLTSPESLGDSISPESASINSVCPLPSTPAMPTISPARTSNETPSTRAAPAFDRTDRPRTLSFVSPGFARGISTRSNTSRPTINRASCAALVSRVCRRPTRPAIPHHRHLVGDRQHLRQLVGDDHDRLSLLAHAAEDQEELVNLRRGQHRRGFIEDQQLRVAIERLQQLDALLLADGERLDDGIGIDGELELVRQRCGSQRPLSPDRAKPRIPAPLPARCFPPRSSVRPA